MSQRARYRVSGLFRYPLKSAAGVRSETIELDEFGVRSDRRWMIVGPAGAAVTQREVPRLALLRARRTDGGLHVRWTGDVPSDVEVTEPSRTASRIPVTLWDTTVHLPLAGADANAWLAGVLDRDVRFAYMPHDVVRPVNPRYASAGTRTSLTDGYPLHLIGSGSLDDLNARLDRPVGVERFRPNLFIDGTPPYDEDAWAEIRVGACRLRVVKPCPRCTVTTVDQSTGERGKEPLRTLAEYRRADGGVMFGQNAVHQGTGTIRVGDEVEILSRRDSRED